MRVVWCLSWLVGLNVLLVACAPVSEEECRAGDWYGMGLRSGQAGAAPSAFDSVARTCAELGVTPDAQAWLIGREQGLRGYCTPKNAYSIARNGDNIRTRNCHAEDIDNLAFAENWGLQYHELGQRESDLSARLSDLRADLSGVAANNPAAAKAIYVEARRLEDRRDALRRERTRYATLPF